MSVWVFILFFMNVSPRTMVFATLLYCQRPPLHLAWHLAPS